MNTEKEKDGLPNRTEHMFLLSKIHKLMLECAEVRNTIPGLRETAKYDAEQRLQSLVKDINVLKEYYGKRYGVVSVEFLRDFKSWSVAKYIEKEKENNPMQIWDGEEEAAARINKQVVAIRKEKDLSKIEKMVEKREKLIAKYERKYGCWKSYISGNQCYICGDHKHTENNCALRHAKNKKLVCKLCGVEGHVKVGCMMNSDVAPFQVNVKCEEFKHLKMSFIREGTREVVVREPSKMKVRENGERYLAYDENIHVRMEQWKNSVDIPEGDFDVPSGWKGKYVPTLSYRDWKSEQKLAGDPNSKQKLEAKRQERLDKAIGADTPVDDKLMEGLNKWQIKADRITESRKKLPERVEPYIEDWFNNMVCLDVGVTALTEGVMQPVGKTPRKKRVVRLVNYEALGVPKKLDFDQPNMGSELDKLTIDELEASLAEVNSNKDAVYAAIAEVDMLVKSIETKIQEHKDNQLANSIKLQQEEEAKAIEQAKLRAEKEEEERQEARLERRRAVRNLQETVKAKEAKRLAKAQEWRDEAVEILTEFDSTLEWYAWINEWIKGTTAADKENFFNVNFYIDEAIEMVGKIPVNYKKIVGYEVDSSSDSSSSISSSESESEEDGSASE